MKKGKIVNVVGLTIESAGPDSKLGDICYIFPEDKTKKPIMAEVVGFKEGKTQLMPYDITDGIGIGNTRVPPQQKAATGRKNRCRLNC